MRYIFIQYKVYIMREKKNVKNRICIKIFYVFLAHKENFMYLCGVINKQEC